MYDYLRYAAPANKHSIGFKLDRKPISEALDDKELLTYKLPSDQ